jgi:cytochrome c553
MKKIFLYGILATTIGFSFEACSPAHGNHPGHEYMPDMAHSVAQEANVYNGYSLNTWDKQSVKSLKELSQPRNTVKGSIPRGSVGMAATGNSAEMMAMLAGTGSGIPTTINGNVPYYYGDDEAERTRANKEIVGNPFPITKKGLEEGKELFRIYCGICHGDKGGGDGYLANGPDAKYLAQPANLLLDTFANGNNGRLYHAIMYGKNVMGSYADKLSYEERWKVIHYIRSSQAAAKGLVYNDKQNTFKPLFGTPDSVYKATLAGKGVATKAVPAPAAPETKPAPATKPVSKGPKK